ncbi:uncharacterized protein LOC101051494 [Saimiri boliviensis]|uniref:uncharacterized protein LOC101051494 n=1 Tax=Saimiri boliviensis TaxID=27679 RepID=UPI003D77876B
MTQPRPAVTASVSPGEVSGSGTGERRGSQATPDALTSPGRQNVRPGPRRAEAAAVTCRGPVTQSRGAGTRRAEPAGGGRPQARARRRDSTYLPGFGSGSAGRGAAGALPPSFLLPSPPPAARHTILAGSGSRTEARVSGTQGVGGRSRPGLEVPAEEEERGLAMRTSGRRQGREGTRRGRWPRCRRPGDPRKPLQKQARACARSGAEAHCPQGAGGRPGRRACLVPAPGPDAGQAPPLPVQPGVAEEGGAGAACGLPHFSCLRASPVRGWLAAAAANYVADLRGSAGTSLPTRGALAF